MGTKGEKTRSDIIACAKNLFYQRGYDATSFSDIVDASGLYRGNIYHYFKTKDEILGAVVDKYLTDLRLLTAQWSAKYATPKERMLAFVGMVAGNPELMNYGCPIGSLNMELGKERRELQLAARALFDCFRDWLAEQLLALGYGDEANAMAIHLLGRAEGISVMVQVYQDKKLLEREAQGLADWVRQL